MSQPVEVYPNNSVPRQSNSSHSNGSFGPVFAVLAVIVVISAVACVLGRLCNRRHHRNKEAAHHHSKSKKQSHGTLGPKEWEARQEPSFNMRDGGDIEFGFDHKKIPSKVAKNGGGKAKQPHPNGGHKPEVKFADNV